MYNKHIIVGGQCSTALTITFVDVGTKSCASANRTDTNRVSTTRRSVNQLEMLHRNKPSRDTNGFAWIYSLECNNWIFINLLLNSSWSWTPFPPYITWRVHRWTQRTTKVLKRVGFRTRIAHNKLHTILKLSTHSAVFTALVPIPKSDENCSVQHLRSLSP